MNRLIARGVLGIVVAGIAVAGLIALRSNAQDSDRETTETAIPAAQGNSAQGDTMGMMSNIPVRSFAPTTGTLPLQTTATLLTAGEAQALIDIWFAGKRRSNLEPCGCTTEQQGGVQLEASLYEREATGHPELRVDAGEWTSPNVKMSPVDSLKTRFLLRAFQGLEIDAANIGFADVLLSRDYFELIRETTPEVFAPLVSANVYFKEQPDLRAFQPYRIVEKTLPGGETVRIGITGVTTVQPQYQMLSQSPAEPSTAGAPAETDSFLIRDPVAELGPVIEELRPHVDMLVVLYSGQFDDSFATVQKYPQIDFLVSTAQSMDRGMLRYREGNTYVLLTPNFQGKELGRVVTQWSPQHRWLIEQEPELHIVSHDYQPDPELLEVIEAYKQETQTLAVMPDPNVERIYASAVQCMVCHQAEYSQWKETPHAHAMATLVERSQQFNPECQKCHVTGFRNSNGYYSPLDTTFSPQMQNVQCEMCHGPAMQHVVAQQRIMTGKDYLSAEEYAAAVEQGAQTLPNKEVPESLCVQCHTPDNDNSWDYGHKLPKINHKNPFVPEPKDTLEPGNMPAPLRPHAGLRMIPTDRLPAPRKADPDVQVALN